ncbi:hypothetical protein M231_01583 [Tremella mesenterica]|uniref:Uncharacterized protein n=1 Tax=Tremella mesenterica TaxID=5217 RepID=A0A4Q1BT70_TREME|nr:hypothetical protein M231_01583 [Tremella mesenterica]
MPHNVQAERHRLPIQIQNRIIHFCLALTPSIPPPLTADEPVTPEWDRMAGMCGRRARTKRMRERSEVQRLGLRLMRVCKAWKPLAAKYLYTEPLLTPYNLLSFASSLGAGEAKWSDLNLHPYSTPGRYVKTLDLSHILDGSDAPHPLYVTRACRSILSLIPNLTHFILPLLHTHILEYLINVDNCNFPKLRAIEGIDIHLVQCEPTLQRLSPHLEFLNLYGLVYDPHISSLEDSTLEETILSFPKLHTLVRHGSSSRDGISSMICHSEMPKLSRLSIAPCQDTRDELEFINNFLVLKGTRLISLTILEPREWPPRRTQFPYGILEFLPNLRHLSVLCTGDLNRLLENAKEHKLEVLTIPKPNAYIPSPSPSPVPAPTLGPLNPYGGGMVGQGLLAQSVVSEEDWSGHTGFSHQIDKLRNILTRAEIKPIAVVLDGYRWLPHDMGLAALEAGVSGRMRRLACRLKSYNVELRDMNGKQAPCLGEHQRGRSGTRGLSPVSPVRSPDRKGVGDGDGDEDGG